MMRQQHLVETILDSFAELTALHEAAAAAAERVWSLLAEHDGVDLSDCACRNCPHRHWTSGGPRIAPGTFTVHWHGHHCNLGPSILFKLLHRLIRRPGHFYSYDVLMTDVWERRCAGTTVRGAVKRLRQALYAAGMQDLAEAIRGRGKCYGLILQDDGA